MRLWFTPEEGLRMVYPFSSIVVALDPLCSFGAFGDVFLALVWGYVYG